MRLLLFSIYVCLSVLPSILYFMTYVIFFFNFTRKMNPEDVGYLHFPDDQWQACPTTTDGSLLSPDDVLDKDVRITFKIFLMRTHKDKEYWDDEIGTGRSFVLRYCPGDPVNIVQVCKWVSIMDVFLLHFILLSITTLLLSSRVKQCDITL